KHLLQLITAVFRRTGWFGQVVLGERDDLPLCGQQRHEQAETKQPVEVEKDQQHAERDQAGNQQGLRGFDAQAFDAFERILFNGGAKLFKRYQRWDVLREKVRRGQARLGRQHDLAGPGQGFIEELGLYVLNVRADVGVVPGRLAVVVDQVAQAVEPSFGFNQLVPGGLRFRVVIIQQIDDVETGAARVFAQIAADDAEHDVAAQVRVVRHEGGGDAVAQLHGLVSGAEHIVNGGRQVSPLADVVGQFDPLVSLLARREQFQLES